MPLCGGGVRVVPLCGGGVRVVWGSRVVGVVWHPYSGKPCADPELMDSEKH